MNDYELIGILIGVIVLIVVVMWDIARTGQVMNGYIRFVEGVTSNSPLTHRLEERYAALPPAQRVGIDTALMLADWLVTLTPDQRDDIVKRWTADIRDGVQPPA